MATGIFKLRDQLLGLVQKAWSFSAPVSTYAGSFGGTTSAQYLSVPTTTFPGDFCIECWFNLVYLQTTQTLFTIGDTLSPNNGIEVQFSAGTALVYSNGTSIIYGPFGSVNTWVHCALTRSGTSLRFFINGNQVSTTATNSTTLTGVTRIGVEYYNTGLSTYFWGQISNFRMVKGNAVYTSTFIPPILPLTAISGTYLLTLQNATIVDNSGSSLTITNNGSISTSIAYPFGILNTATPAVEYLVVAGGGGGGYENNGGAGGGGGGGLLQGILPITNGTPYTITVGAGGAVAASNTVTATNGANSVFGSISASGGGGGAARLNGASGGSGGAGGDGTNGTVWSGGQGIFGQGNKSGTPVTSYNSAPGGGGAGTVGLNSASNTVGGNGGAGIASAITGTTTNYSGGGAGGAGPSGGSTGGTGGVGGGGNGGYNNGSTNFSPTAGSVNTGGGAGGSGNYTGYGAVAGAAGGSGIVIISYPDTYNPPVSFGGANNPTVSTSGSGSLSFNGSSQYITTPTSSNLALGTSNFSVEAWVYKTSISGNQLAIGSSVTGNLDPILLYFNNGSNNAVFYLSSNGSTFDIASAVSIGTVSLNTWAHLAVTRVGSTFTTYLNGAQTSTFTSSASIYKSVNTFTLGAGQTSLNYFNGYMSNVRIVIGASAYSAPFTPSTTPLTPITNTQLLLNTVSGAQFVDSSTNSFASTITGSPTWSQISPFATGLGYKNRVYTWTSSGTVTF